MMSRERLISKEQLAKMIDHTLLKPSDTEGKIKRLCEEAIAYGFGAVCVNPYYVPLVSELLKDTGIKVCAVVGFPLGATLPEVKAHEARIVVEKGAQEVDMVMNIGAMRSRDYEAVKRDIEGVVRAVREVGGELVKVILETGYLTDDEKVRACELAMEAGADYVKTSTGFGPMGALPEDVRLMRKVVGDKMGIKAAGGIGNFMDALRLIEAGADRIGASAGVGILEGYDWAELTNSWFVEPIPCTLCPSRYADLSKQPTAVYLYYKERCRTCPDKEFNRFYER